jgi:methionine synthase II (cobalamin-independent)
VTLRKDMLIEELIAILPESVRYLMDRGIKAVACGEPIWGTLEDAAKEKGYTNEQIETMVTELSDLLSNKQLRVGHV